MVQAVFSIVCLQGEAPQHFTVVIEDDVTHTRSSMYPSFPPEESKHRARDLFLVGRYGTVGAKKNSMKTHW